MARTFRVGDCVRIPDGRIGRVREVSGREFRVRVQRTTSATHQFLIFAAKDLKCVSCPKGWMSPDGYVRYLTVTLANQRHRLGKDVDMQDRTPTLMASVLTIGHSILLTGA